ncbi:hypothetical protein V8E51_011719 [Hyaloscypha variabilis]|jgi:hypothetical protein
MADFKPDEEFIKRSKARLSSIFHEKFKQREAAREEKLAEDKVTSKIFRNLAKGDDEIAKVGEKVRQRLVDRLKQPRSKHENALAEPRDFGAENDIRGPPYDWDWTWEAQSGNATFTVSADKTTGNISFAGSTGDGGSASCASAVGLFFQPKSTSALLQVIASPSLSYEYDAYRFLDAVRSHAFVGVYVGEYTLKGEFVRAVIDQQISLWEADSDVGGFSGNNSGFPLFSAGSADNDHFYEVWVWAGADIEGSGWDDVFDWSGAYAQLSASVPSISVFSLS